MGKTLIKVDCVDQRLIVTSAPTVASGGKNEDEIEFNFCSKWDGFEKVGVFYRDIKDPHKATIDPTGRCVIPWEVLTSDGYIFIGAFGVKDDITRTTEILKYKVKLGAITEDLKPSDPTPELWEQVFAKVLNQEIEMRAVSEAVEQNKIDIEDLKTNLSAFEKNRPFNLTGNPVQVESFEGMPLNPITVLEPQQQGNGDPYPAGGGKNLCPYVLHNEMCALRLLAGHSYVVSISDASASDITMLLYNDGTGASYFRSVPINRVEGGRRYGTFTLDRDTTHINFTWGATAALIEPQIEEGETVTEYAPYSNIRPIIGYDKLELNHAGKNLCNISPFLSAWATENADMLSLLNTLAPGTYTVSVVFEMQNPERASATDKCGLFFYPHGERVFVEWGSVAVGTTRRVTCTFNVTADNAGKFTAAYFYGCGADGIGYTGYATAKDVQLEINTTATTYAPYQNKLHTVQIEQTVYGFRYEWLTGKGVIEWAMLTFDGSEDEGWSLYEYDQDKASVFNYNVDALPGIVDTGDTLIPGICSWIASEDGIIVGIFRASTNSQHMEIPHETLVKWGVAKDLNAFKSKLAANPMQIAYKLAQPIEIQLDAHEILALQGVNTLYGDGEINITGRSDMQAVVSNLLKRIAVLESKANETE